MNHKMLFAIIIFSQICFGMDVAYVMAVSELETFGLSVPIQDEIQDFYSVKNSLPGILRGRDHMLRDWKETYKELGMKFPNQRSQEEIIHAFNASCSRAAVSLQFEKYWYTQFNSCESSYQVYYEEVLNTFIEWLNKPDLIPIKDVELLEDFKEIYISRKKREKREEKGSLIDQQIINILSNAHI